MTTETKHDVQTAIPLAPEDAFEAVQNSRRRLVVLSLSRMPAEETMTAGDLAVEIAAIENAVEPSAVSSEMRTTVYISLIQTHLEKLDKVGAVEYDDRSKQVWPTEATEPLARYIRELQTACYDPGGDDE